MNIWKRGDSRNFRTGDRVVGKFWDRQRRDNSPKRIYALVLLHVRKQDINSALSSTYRVLSEIVRHYFLKIIRYRREFLNARELKSFSRFTRLQARTRHVLYYYTRYRI